ncbi:MAG: hypothetical protein KDE32_11705 [Novosphingobium sp.]|nr:hypothetical protein [Novosphingobium sp.]
MFESKTKFRRAILAVALATVGLAGATTAQARDGYRDRGDDAAIAIGAGIVGLAIGALLADRDDRYYRDSRWYSQRRYVRVRGYPDYYYYYPNNPRRYYRDRYYDRNYGAYYSGRSYYRNYDRRWRDDYRGRDYRYRDRGYRYSDRDYRYRGGY